MTLETAAAAQEISIPNHIASVLVDAAAYADTRIHDTYSWLRQNNPLGRADVQGYNPFWVITRHADILEVSRNNAVFSSELGQIVLMTRESDEQIRAATGGSPHIGQSLIQMDDPKHRAYRALTQAWFMPANLRKIEEKIRGLAHATVNKFLAMDGQCDFVTDIALHYPLQVMMELIGVPAKDYARILKLAQEVFAPEDPDVVRSRTASDADAHAKTLLVSIGELKEYFVALTQERRASPKDDLATLIANSDVLGAPITDYAASGYFVILATAGHDTTSSSVAGAMEILAQRPDIFARLKNDPALLPKFVEEVIRWTTPVKTFMRTASQDTELAGRKIAKGDWLMMCYASGNRDEAVFEDPFEFNLDRKPNNQVAFGSGGHVCLGQHLARLEMRVLFEELLQRTEAVDLSGEPVMIKSSFVNGLKSLPISFVAA